MTFSPTALDCMASFLRSEVNWTATRSRSFSVPKSSAPVQPRPPRVRVHSSQPRRPGHSVQLGRPAPPGGVSQSCSPEREPRARLLADPLGFLPQPARVLAHPPGRVLPGLLGLSPRSRAADSAAAGWSVSASSVACSQGSSRPCRTCSLASR